VTSGPDPAAEARALLVLDALPRVGPATVRRLVAAFGSGQAALTARRRTFSAVAGGQAARARSDPAVRAAVDRGLARAEAVGASIVAWGDDRYPPGLMHLADPPPVLFLRGRAHLLHGPCVTVVGSRRATERGRDVSARLGRDLVRAGGVVVSGLALGVDGAAHAGALRSGGDTVAVLGTGPDVVYPRAHARLFDRVAAEGLLVSEFLPGTPAAPHHFPRRNRILAALSSTVVVVEAGRRSGSLITVDHALDLGREVWAVPGPIDGAACAGSNRMLSDGARPLVSIPHFVREVLGARAAAPGPGGAGPAGGRRDSSDRGPTGSAAVEARVLAAVADEPCPVDDLARRVGVPVETLLAHLTILELFGEVERLPGLRFRRAA
jgi:DNA processing protein